MKYLLLSIFTMLLVQQTMAQGWRSGEKQIVITLESQEQADIITALKLSFDFVNDNQVRAYVIPKEIAILELNEINFEVEIEDLNKQELIQFSEVAYHSYQEIIDLADSLEQEFPEICEKYIFGESLGGRQLAALKISDNVAEDELEAEILFDGGIHGDEICGPENIIRFARDMCIDYGTDPDITDLINNREIWLYLMVNPDGREAVPRSRYNNNGVDLNRDWGYMWDGWGSSTGAYSQVESKALRSCMYNNQFVVHTTYHGGTEYISLPWSYRSSQPPDWNHIYQLGGVYASTSLYPNLEYGQGNTGMYAINGSTKDSNYGVMGSISWSMEISYDKQPPVSQLMLYYNRNYPAMMAMIEYAGYGLEGIVSDAMTGDPVTASVFVENYMPTYTDPTAGDYHKYVLPGTYSITIMANGYETQTIDNVVVTTNSATSTNFELQPENGQYVYKFSASRIPDNNEADEGNTPAVIGAPDDVRYSIGKNGWVVLDMQDPVIDGPGIDIIVYENDATPEGYECFAAETMDGPWLSLGTGNGTSEFDLSLAPLVEAQFIKIVDDGNGSANVNDAGFDLDAIEALEPVSGIYIALYDYEIDDSNGNGNGRIDPGETVDIIVNLKNNGDITANNTTGVISTSSSFVTIDNNTVNFGTLAQGQSAEGIFTITANSGTPQGEPVAISMEVTASGGSYSNNFMMSFTVGLIVEDWETGNFEQFEWESGGDNTWTISTQDPYEGTYCVKSGTIGDQEISFLSISFDVLANGEVGFFKKVSSESSYDFLKFYIDNNLIDQWSGEVSWSGSTYPVTAGQHTFKWEYEKDYSVSGGSDCAWLDFITLPSGALTAIFASFAADDTEICEGEMVNFTDASSGDVISWEWIFEGGSPASSSFQNPSVAYFDTGSYDVTLTVSDGTNSHTIVYENYIAVDETPELPATPEGEDLICINFVWESEYTTTGSVNANSYIWNLSPEDAGTISGSGIVGEVEWNQDYIGLANIKVKGVNACGEGEFSESFEVMVDVCGGIDKTAKKSLRIIPNPAINQIIVKFAQEWNGVYQVSVLNNLGEIVIPGREVNTLENSSLVLNVENLETGIYYLVVRNNESIYNELLIIR